MLLFISSCRKDFLQEECDRQSTIEYFLERYEPREGGIGLDYSLSLMGKPETFKDEQYLIYQVLKDIEYRQYRLLRYDNMRKVLKEDISLVYGRAPFYDYYFILFGDLERVCIYRLIDSHIDFHYSYRYYRIGKTDGLRIMEAVEKLEMNKNETN